MNSVKFRNLSKKQFYNNIDRIVSLNKNSNSIMQLLSNIIAGMSWNKARRFGIFESNLNEDIIL